MSRPPALGSWTLIYTYGVSATAGHRLSLLRKIQAVVGRGSDTYHSRLWRSRFVGNRPEHNQRRDYKKGAKTPYAISRGI